MNLLICSDLYNTEEDDFPELDLAEIRARKLGLRTTWWFEGSLDGYVRLCKPDLFVIDESTASRWNAGWELKTNCPVVVMSSDHVEFRLAEELMQSFPGSVVQKKYATHTERYPSPGLGRDFFVKLITALIDHKEDARTAVRIAAGVNMPTNDVR